MSPFWVPSNLFYPEKFCPFPMGVLGFGRFLFLVVPRVPTTGPVLGGGRGRGLGASVGEMGSAALRPGLTPAGAGWLSG